MRFKQITFSVARAMPLQPITGRSEDAYANVKPFASVTVEFDEDEPTQLTKENLDVAKAIVVEALEHAQGAAFDSVAKFSKEFRAALKPKSREQ